MKTSRIIQGLMRTSNLSIDDLYRLIIFDLEQGINTFDLADIYDNGEAEHKLGEVLRLHPELRSKMYIQSKVSIRLGESESYYDLSYKHIKDAVNACLARLNIEYLDSLLLHRIDIFIDKDEVSKAIDELFLDGKIKHFGVSNASNSVISYLSTSLKQKIEVNQIQFGIGHPHIAEEVFKYNVDNSLDSSSYFYMKSHDIKIQAWSPFMVGLFEGSIFDEYRYPDINNVLSKMAYKYQTSKCAIAAAFVLALNKDIALITGSMDEKHILEALEGERITLSKEDWYTLYKESGHLLP